MPLSGVQEKLFITLISTLDRRKWTRGEEICEFTWIGLASGSDKNGFSHVLHCAFEGENSPVNYASTSGIDLHS